MEVNIRRWVRFYINIEVDLKLLLLYHSSNRPCRVKVYVYLWIIETIRPGNDIYSNTWAKAIVSYDSL